MQLRPSEIVKPKFRQMRFQTLSDVERVSERIEQLASIGVTELLANVVGSPEEQARTVAHLGVVRARQARGGLRR